MSQENHPEDGVTDPTQSGKLSSIHLPLLRNLALEKQQSHLKSILNLQPHLKTLNCTKTINQTLEKCKDLADDFSSELITLTDQISALNHSCNANHTTQQSQFLKQSHIQISNFCNFLDLTSHIFTKI